MAVITPLLDTLLHDVLGKRMDPPAPRQMPEAVRPVSPEDALTALRSDSRLHTGHGPVTGQYAGGARADRIMANALGTQALSPESDAGNKTAVGSRPNDHSNLSPTARTIAELLQRFPAQPSVLRPMTPLLPGDSMLLTTAGRAAEGAAANTGALVAENLQSSISGSGLFYESHLARWYRGDYPQKQLQMEPQANAAQAEKPQGPVGTQPLAELLRNEQLQALVRHQLEVLTTPVLRWEGDVWSGLFMSLIIHVPPEQLPGNTARQQSNEKGREAADDTADEWHSSMKLVVQGLGSIMIDLRLHATGIAVGLRAAADLVPRLEAGVSALQARFQHCGFEQTDITLQASGSDSEGVADE